MSKPLTPKNVQMLYATMTQYYDTELSEHWNGDRETSMAVLTLYLGAIGVKNVPYFLDVCDISMGHEIYLPRDPICNKKKGDLLISAVSCASAHQRILHLQQCDRPAECELLYLLSPVSRVYAELEALQAALEVYQWSQNAARVPADWNDKMDVDEFLEDFKLYGCTDLSLEIAEARPRLVKMIEAVKSGEVTCDAARDVIRFFGWDMTDARG